MTIELHYESGERRFIEDPNYDVSNRPHLIKVQEQFFVHNGHGKIKGRDVEIYHWVRVYEL